MMRMNSSQSVEVADDLSAVDEQNQVHATSVAEEYWTQKRIYVRNVYNH